MCHVGHTRAIEKKFHSFYETAVKPSVTTCTTADTWLPRGVQDMVQSMVRALRYFTRCSTEAAELMGRAWDHVASLKLIPIHIYVHGKHTCVAWGHAKM